MPPRYGLVLGTVCTVNAFGDGSAALYDELFSRLESIDRLCNANRADSELSRLNLAADGSVISVQHELFSLLEAALAVAALTDGAFNPASGPLVALWGIGTEYAHVPAETDIQAARVLCDWRDIVLSGSSGVQLCKSGMEIDLGGIAKGYAADELVTILRAHHVKRAIVNLGGNIYVYGAKANGSSWQVGIKNPLAPEGAALCVLETDEAGVVTSGIYERYFDEDGVRYHHILDTATGKPAASGVLSVTVVDKNATEADALSTALLVMGVEEGLALVERSAGVEAVFIDSNCAIHASSGIRLAR